jgi:hypothetical protein
LDDLAPQEYTVVCDGRRLPYKPDPAGIVTVLGRAGTQRAVLVGDRLTDVLAGKLAGIATVRVRARCADAERGSALRQLVRPDRLVSAGGCYAAIRDVLGVTSAPVAPESASAPIAPAAAAAPVAPEAATAGRGRAGW